MVKKSLFNDIIKSIGTEKQTDTWTVAHSGRMVRISGKFGNYLNLSMSDQDRLETIAVLHDIGKLFVPDSILNKKGKLDDNEWIEMQKHCEIGFDIVMKYSELSYAADSILSHHERWDGRGYPNNLRGHEIPYYARIIAVLDSYDAMTHDRPYRKAMSKKQALEEIKATAGSQFDPDIAFSFISIF